MSAAIHSARVSRWPVLRAGRVVWLMLIGAWSATAAMGAQPKPVLNSVFPPGGRAGTSVEVTIAGSGLAKVARLRCSHPAIQCESDDGKLFRLTIPGDVPNGHYDVSAVTENGLSSVRSFVVGSLAEQSESAANDSLDTAEMLALETVINGRIEKAGDVDHFVFAARRGQRIVLECLAERVDSRLRAVLEVFDSAGRRVAVNRGFFGIDPLICFDVPDDGEYRVRIFDLVYSGSAEHVYRLSIDTAPHVVFTVPGFVQRGVTSPVRLFGWNLGNPARTQSTGASGFETGDVKVAAPQTPGAVSPFRLSPPQIATNGFAYHFPGSSAPVRLALSDVPVTRAPADNHSPSAAQPISIPAEVSGQLIGGGELDWFRFDAKRGEVFWIEAFGERLNSPVDLDVTVLDAAAQNELARFSDRRANIGGSRFVTAHSDPSGRWVAPADGTFLVLVRSLVNSSGDNPRRVYHLSMRREEPDFDLAVIARSDDPGVLNIPRGGRTVVDVLAFRRRGLNGSIRVSARNLPEGVECPDIWLGPGVDRAPLVLSATDRTGEFTGPLIIEGHADGRRTRRASGGSVVRKGLPTGWSRLTDEIGLSIAGEAAVKLTADAHRTRGHDLYGDLHVRHSPGSVLDVHFEIDRRDIGFQADVKLIGIGLPQLMRNRKTILPAGQSSGHVSFYLPPTLSVGSYTIAIQAETTVPIGAPDASGKRKTESVTIVSNPVTFEVHPPAFVVELDQDAPTQIHRGEVLQVKYSARRVNGFISKIHTELFSPDGIDGIRGRGVTFVGQTESGNIQIIANEDAPLGKQRLLRLYAVGVLEDEPVYHGSCFLPLEIVE